MEGFSIKFDAISQEQEQELLNILDNYEWDDSLKRKVIHFGHRYHYNVQKKQDKVYVFDDWLIQLHNQVSEMFDAKVPENTDLFQCIVNRYEVGQGIADHIDDCRIFDGIIFGLSLGSQCLMTFTNKDDNSDKKEFLLPSRSVFCLQSDARYKYKHGIVKRQSDMIDGVRVKRGVRTSITFRYLKNKH